MRHLYLSPRDREVILGALDGYAVHLSELGSAERAMHALALEGLTLTNDPKPDKPLADYEIEDGDLELVLRAFAAREWPAVRAKDVRRVLQTLKGDTDG